MAYVLITDFFYHCPQAKKRGNMLSELLEYLQVIMQRHTLAAFSSYKALPMSFVCDEECSSGHRRQRNELPVPQ